jgi:hypothetical protein
LSNFGSCVNISVFFDAGDKSDADDGFVASEDWPDVDAGIIGIHFISSHLKLK